MSKIIIVDIKVEEMSVFEVFVIFYYFFIFRVFYFVVFDNYSFIYYLEIILFIFIKKM